jgi:hypothetical protein
VMVYGFLAFFSGADDVPSPPPLSAMIAQRLAPFFSMPELRRHPRTSIYTAPSAHELPCKSISGLNFGGQLLCLFRMDASSCQFLHGSVAILP